MVEFDGVCDFERSTNGLVPVQVDTWGRFCIFGQSRSGRWFAGQLSWQHSTHRRTAAIDKKKTALL